MLATTWKLYFQDSMEMYYLAVVPYLSIWIFCFWAFFSILLWQFRVKSFLYLYFWKEALKKNNSFLNITIAFPF